MKIERSYNPANRYLYDSGQCSSANGWAQVDTGQDASYYGQWANPFTLQTLCYCEGDIIVTTSETPEEFAAELRRVKAWNEEQGHGFLGIDPGNNFALNARFVTFGMEDLLHEPYRSKTTCPQ